MVWAHGARQGSDAHPTEELGIEFELVTSGNCSGGVVEGQMQELQIEEIDQLLQQSL